MAIDFFSLPYNVQCDIVERTRRKYPTGTRLMLTKDMVDIVNGKQNPYAPKAGTMGTVLYIDDAASIHVGWDNGSSLALVYDAGDDFKEV